MNDLILANDELMHYGILRKSGRYPWGSGENPYQSNKNFLAYVSDLRSKGLSETEIAQGIGITTTQLRAVKAIAKNANRHSDMSMAQRLKDKGYSNTAIGERMGLNESSVRALLDPAAKDRNDVLVTTANMLKDNLSKNKYLDIGAGVENHLGISQTKLSTAVAMLQEEGYVVHNVKVTQLGTGKETTIKVLAPPDTTWVEIVNNKDKIGGIKEYSEDGGRSYLGLEKPKSVNSNRIEVRYAEEGGTEKDGVIELRPGVDDISLGGAHYAQTRIAVDDSHYLKGMAVYSNDLPDGVDVRFNTNKSSTGNKLDAMKKLKDDPDNPFGSVVRQRHYTDSSGKKQLSAINIVYEEGDWDQWSKTLSSQVLSKQNHKLAKQQLDLAYQSKQDEFDEIMSLTNPVVKQHMLGKFADSADSSAVHLKAASLPRQRTQVILPVNSLKETEIYAPNFRDGERVVLIRYPHGGIFEIPELTVNNRHKAAKDTMGRAIDAVGINSKVAERLSGADFDGDTVLVIPNNNRAIKTSKPLEGLKNFDPQRAYPGYEGMKPMSARAKQQQMGDVSNLITDMTIQGANDNELARAVRHSMVVIDAEKHKLNYRQSAKDNGIKELKTKYQGKSNAGASTLISRASAEIRVPERKLKKGGGIDPKTGRLQYEETGAGYTNAKGKWVPRTTSSTKMAEVDDAFKLVSKNGIGTPIEAAYANHANKLKALANEARKQSLSVKMRGYSPSAKEAYANEVGSLKAKLNTALKNKPLERQAQLIAGTVVDAKKKANPQMEPDELKKIKSQALAEARVRSGADKQRIVITPAEWQAIQSGAVSTNIQRQILQNTDLEHIKSLATPRTSTGMTAAKMSRARSMAAAGYTQAEIADALGVSVSSITSALK